MITMKIIPLEPRVKILMRRRKRGGVGGVEKKR